MSEDLLAAYERLHRTGPEFGGDEEGNHGLTNHGPMAAEVMVRRNLDIRLDIWLDNYMTRLTDLPAPSERITTANWREALGNGHRIADWTAFFRTEVRARPWRETLATWWPRLLPGIAAGSTHGVIRVGHAVRTLLATTSPQALEELANGLAFWAARWRPLPGGAISPTEATDSPPELPDRSSLTADHPSRGHPGSAPAPAEDLTKSAVDHRHPHGRVGSPHPNPAGAAGHGTSSHRPEGPLRDVERPEEVLQDMADVPKQTSGHRNEPPTRPDGRVGSPHPNPGGHPEAILQAGPDKTPGQRGLWTTLGSESERKGHSYAGEYQPTPGEALDALPELPDRSGFIAHRLARLGGLPAWPRAVAALGVPAPEEVPAVLAALVDAATVRYLRVGRDSPVLLVHTATAPNAVLHCLPALPMSLWRASLSAAWVAAAAITVTYAGTPTHGTSLLGGDDPAGVLLDRAADHRDEHVLKFADTAVESYERTRDLDALAAAHLAADLIQTTAPSSRLVGAFRGRARPAPG